MTPANCSFHLRLLARHGFVEEAEGGVGRQRLWRLVEQETRISTRDAVQHVINEYVDRGAPSKRRPDTAPIDISMTPLRQPLSGGEHG
ncbi:hypothetical protein ALI22I_07475 [Saccharothrix sp. ALI-22-I]|nr:hypothetical protein ALI22I_07475 [Saccharothrix sp. ALI-22-I]